MILETAQISALQLRLRFLQQPQRFGDGKRADAIVKGARDGQVIAQQFEFIVQA